MRHLALFLALLTLPIGRAEARPGDLQKRQNRLADQHKLPRFQDLEELTTAIQTGRLVPIEDTHAYHLHSTFGESDPDQRHAYAHAQPWLKAFLDQELGKAHRLFKTRFAITSLTRTQQYQARLCKPGLAHGPSPRRLKQKNANAICGTGWKRSLHLTGSAVDIGTLRLPKGARTWLLGRLKTLAGRGKLVFINEGGQQSCFHILVLPTYAQNDRSDQRPSTARL